MVTVKASQKLFTYAEVARLTGICAEHLRNVAKRHRLGFIARAETAGTQADQWLFTPWDLTVLVSLFPRCTHGHEFEVAAPRALLSSPQDGD